MRKEVDNVIRGIGEDLRNDLNNPLQEIVAMVSYAKTRGDNVEEGTALDAIDRAAQNMARVVSGIEDKMRNAVGNRPARGRK